MDSDTAKLAPYDREKYMKTVPVKFIYLATILLDLLETTFGKEKIKLHKGMPVVTRDMEWVAGFSMKKDAPHVYIYSPHAREAMKEELGPWKSGEESFKLWATKELTLADGIALVGRAFRLAKYHKGNISKARSRRRAAKAKPAKATSARTKAARAKAAKAAPRTGVAKLRRTAAKTLRTAAAKLKPSASPRKGRAKVSKLAKATRFVKKTLGV